MSCKFTERWDPPPPGTPPPHPISCVSFNMCTSSENINIKSVAHRWQYRVYLTPNKHVTVISKGGGEFSARFSVAETPELSLPPWRCGLCGENHRTLAAGAVLSSGSNSFKCLVLLVEDAGFSSKKIQNPQYLKNIYVVSMHFVHNFHFQPFLVKTISFDSIPSCPDFVSSILEARGTTFGVQGYAATLAAVPQTSIQSGLWLPSTYPWRLPPRDRNVWPLWSGLNKNPCFFPFIRPGWLEGDVNKQVFFLCVFFSGLLFRYI